MAKGKYKSTYAIRKRADMIGRVRLKAAEYRRKGNNKSLAFKKAWKKVKKERW